MLYLQVCFRRVTLLVFVLSCVLGKSCGFQVSPAFTKRRNQHQLPSDVRVHHSLAPSPDLKRNHAAACMSSMALRSKQHDYFDSRNLYWHSFDPNVSPSHERSPLLHRSDEFRLHGAKRDDDSAKSSKIRSFISKVYNALTSRVVSCVSPFVTC
jgi:hypothetical protein